MFRYKLRTLLILLVVGPPILAATARMIASFRQPGRAPSAYDFVVVSGGGVEPAVNLKLRESIVRSRNGGK